MTTPTHIALGYLVAEGFTRLGLASPDAFDKTLLLSVIAANAPDADVLMFWKMRHHRINSYLHYPVVWILLITGTALYLMFFLPTLLQIIPLIMVNIMMHFILDTFGIEVGIRWAWPWKKTYYSFIPSRTDIPKSIGGFIRKYLTLPVLYIEIGFWILTAIFALYSFGYLV